MHTQANGRTQGNSPNILPAAQISQHMEFSDLLLHISMHTSSISCHLLLISAGHYNRQFRASSQPSWTWEELDYWEKFHEENI